MTNLESLRSLQMRIREATGPDREIDLEICKVFGIFKSVMKRLDAQGSLTADNLGAAPFTLDPDGLGPCVALQRAVLPGACLDLCIWDDDATKEAAFAAYQTASLKIYGEFSCTLISNDAGSDAVSLNQSLHHTQSKEG